MYFNTTLNERMNAIKTIYPLYMDSHDNDSLSYMQNQDFFTFQTSRTPEKLDHRQSIYIL